MSKYPPQLDTGLARLRLGFCLGEPDLGRGLGRVAQAKVDEEGTLEGDVFNARGHSRSATDR